MENKHSQASTKLIKGIDQLKPLIGEWDIAITDTAYWANVVQGHAIIEPIGAGAFLGWSSDYETPGPPSSIAMIGADEAEETCTVLYHDIRGVSRVLHTQLVDHTWKTWRDAPGFAQRLIGSLSSDEATIRIKVEKSLDNSTWEQDFIMTYTRRT